MEYIEDNATFIKYLYQHCNCVNAGQTQEERRFKYKLARYLGSDFKSARIYRDRRPNNFAKHYGYASWKHMLDYIAEGG